MYGPSHRSTRRRTPNHAQLRVIEQWRESRGRDSATVADVPSEIRFAWGAGIRGWYARLRECYSEAIEASRPPRIQRDADELQSYAAALSELRDRDESLARVVRANRDPVGDNEERRLNVEHAIRREVAWLAERLGVPRDPPDAVRSPGQEGGFYPPDMLLPPEQERDYWGKEVDHERRDFLEIGRRGEDVKPRKRRPSRPKPAPLTTAEKRLQSAERRLDARVAEIEKLLRRTPDLSENEIRKRLAMGRAQVANALAHGRASKRLDYRGSLRDPSYFALSGPYPKNSAAKATPIVERSR